MRTKAEALGFLQVRIGGHRAGLATRCRTLAKTMTLLAERLEGTEPHGCMCLNVLGEVQAQGPIIDAECGRFMATAEAIRVLEDIEQ